MADEDGAISEVAGTRSDPRPEAAQPSRGAGRLNESRWAKFRPVRWRLATRVIVIAVTLLAALLAILLIAYAHAFAERRRAEVANAVALGQVVTSVIGGFAQDLETTTLAAAGALGTRDRPIDQATAGPYLRALADEYGMLRGLFVTDPRGRVIASASGEGVGTDLSARPYLQSLQQGAPTVWGPGVAGIQSGEVTVTFGRAVRGPDGALRGYLIAAFYPPRLAERLRGSLPPDADLTLVDGRGLILHSTSRPNLPIEQRDVSRVSGIAAALRGEVVRLEGWAEFFNDEPRFGVVAPVPITGWAVAFTRPLTPLEAMLRNQFLAQTGGVAAAVLLAGLVLILATRRITRPLGQLADAATAVARGERIEVPVEGEAEVGQLAAAMRVMSAAVAEREDSLRFLARASELLARSLDVEVTLQTIADLAVPTLADWCIIDLLTDDAESRRIATASHDPALAPLMAELRRYPFSRDNLDHPSAAASARGEAVLIPDVTPEYLAGTARNREHLRVLQALNPRSLIAVPLIARERALGTIQLLSVGRRYGPTDLASAQDLAHRCALALENAQLYEAVQRGVQVRDEFISVAAHELRTPVTSLRGQAQLLLRRLAREAALEPERLQSALSTIESQSAKLARLVAQLLDLSRLEMGKLTLERQPVDLAALVDEVVRHAQATTRHHHLTVAQAPPSLVASVDGPRLEQVLANLVDNAIKYSPSGGDIEVALDETPTGQARVRVTDRGIGIAPEHQPYIFDRFYRGAAANSYPAGLGLGLYVCRQIVELHGGQIALESPPEGGTRFVVTLPLDSPPAR